MQNARFLWNNLWDLGTLTYSSQHSSFPATNSRHRWHTRSWRSRYGVASGWGNFVITAGTNDRIDFEETIATPLVATLTAGTYDADTLATEIKTRLDAAGASTYTVTYSDSTNKFTITSDGLGGGGIFTLLWNSGANKARSVAGTIGFDDSADDNGALTYTADRMRIHSEEWLKNNLGSAQNVQAFVIRQHNFSSTATVRIQGNNADAWGAPAVNVSLTLNADIMIYFWSSVQSQQWWRIYITDVDNSDGYVEIGRSFLGTYFQTAVNFKRDYRRRLVDPTDVIISDGGQLSSNEKTKYQTLALTFEYLSNTDLATLESIWQSRGMHRDFFFCRDADNMLTTTIYCRFANPIDIEHFLTDTLYNVPIFLEELR